MTSTNNPQQNNDYMPEPEMNENVVFPLMQQQYVPPPQQAPNYNINVQPQPMPNYALLPQQQPQYGQPIVSGVPPNGNPAIINNQQVPTIVDPRMFKIKPLTIRCTYCQMPITTVVTKRCNVLAFFLCVCSGILLYILIQACRRKDCCCYDSTHVCPNCGRTVGSYRAC